VVPAGRRIEKCRPAAVFCQDRPEEIPGVRGLHDAELVQDDAEAVDAPQTIRLIRPEHGKIELAPCAVASSICISVSFLARTSAGGK
jgi:hypothetical protein